MLADDLQRAVARADADFEFKLGLYYSFERAAPATAKTAKSHQEKSLNRTYLPDCQTTK